MINVVGLGSTSSKDLTLEAVEIMRNGNNNYLRTDNHDSVKFFKENKISYESFDYLYEESESFEDVYNKIVDFLIEKSKKGDINYFVPGNPFVAEKTVKLLLNSDVDINITSGISFIEPVLAAVGRDAVNGLLFLDSYANRFDFDLRRDTLITQIYNKRIASDVSLSLQEVYRENDLAYVITNAGLEDEIVREIEIYKLQSCVYIPRTSGSSFNVLFSKINNLLRDEDIFLDEEIFEKMKSEVIKKSKNLSMDFENEEDILIYSLILILLKYNEGIIDLRDILEEMDKKLDKIAIFFK